MLGPARGNERRSGFSCISLLPTSFDILLSYPIFLPCHLTLPDETKGFLEKKRDEVPMTGSDTKDVVTIGTSAASKIGDCGEEITFTSSSSSSSMIKMEILEKVHLTIDGDPFARKGF
ncbi:hypothetical protein Fot_28726 [Forsythia ovata]|uniref:Uncharacterized protein n=1 Tax=Forsythia ovata TaxID=205694 RepID=A0ABD1TPT3_9LAMI